MRCLSTLLVLAGSLVAVGAARSQMIYPSAAYSGFSGPPGLFMNAPIPGMGQGGPSVMLYFPTNSPNGFAPSPMNYGVAGVQYPVPGSSGSLLLPGSTGRAMAPQGGGGGLGLPSPGRPPVMATPAAPVRRPSPARRAARAKAAKAQANAPKVQPDAAKAQPPEAPAAKPDPTRGDRGGR